MSYNGFGVCEVPSVARHLGEGITRTAYTVLSDPSDSEDEQPKRLRRVGGQRRIRESTWFHFRNVGICVHEIVFLLF